MARRISAQIAARFEMVTALHFNFDSRQLYQQGCQLGQTMGEAYSIDTNLFSFKEVRRRNTIYYACWKAWAGRSLLFDI